MVVERISTLHENEIINLTEKIKHKLRPDSPEEAFEIRQAVTYVRRNKVHTIFYDSSNQSVTMEIGNKINDETNEQVNLSFNQLNATCTCGQTTWCSHRTAVVFYLYLQLYSLTEWMHEWRRTKTNQMEAKTDERTPEAWNEILSNAMNPIRIIALRENPAVFVHKFSLIEQGLAPLYPHEWEWKPFFDIYVRLHALKAAWPYVAFHLGSESSSFSYGKWYIENWVSEQLGKLEDQVHSIAAKPRLFETDPFYEHLQDFVRTFALEQSGLFQKRFQAYQLFWENLFTAKALRNEEQILLKNKYESNATVFIAFFHILLNEEDKLQQLTTQITENNFSEWLALAELAEDLEHTTVLSRVMEALLPSIENHLNHQIAVPRRPAFVRKIDGLLEAAHFPEEEREKMFAHYGQAGIDVYADFLVERERFYEWAALMHRYEVPHEVTEASGLNVALKADPASVLPLLHLYVMDLIEERNRQSYRRAVRILKKMKTSANKSGKHEFWNRYVQTVRDKYRRLRALMEEMEKGNLHL